MDDKDSRFQIAGAAPEAEKPARPFLKWAGGKKQLLAYISKQLPDSIIDGQRFTYVEPFAGSGAVLFWMLHHFPDMERAVINDVNEDLVNTYRSIAGNPLEVIEALEILQREYHGLEGDQERKKAYFYAKRALYNTKREDKCSQAALFIFLNRTCFNGLYRVNRKNEYNVPMGSYKKPTICDRENILAVSRALQKVEILSGDFEATGAGISGNSFFYLDPPYKPLSTTSYFNAYTKDEFDDGEQIRLRDFCIRLDKEGYKWMLSNSDVKRQHPDDDFFEDIYAGFHIQRVRARRSINADAAKRGALNELLITNYRVCP